jgi:hypothetical protein
MNNYKGISATQKSLMQSEQNDFSQAYHPNSNLIASQNYTNTNQLIHNNLELNLYNESYIEYTIHVDSTDRNTTIFQSPYNFILNFGGAGPSRNKFYNSSGNLQQVDFSGAPDPIIDRKFRNVKSVILDKIFFPKYIGFQRLGAGPIYDYSGNVTLASRYRYVIVRIKELDNNRMYSTNNYVRDDSFVMYNDKTLGEAGVGIWIASPYKRTYLKSSLKNIDKFTIEIVDPKGNPIFPTWDNGGTDENIPQSELTNQDNRDKYNFQIHFIFSVLENELNTKPNFR